MAARLLLLQCPGIDTSLKDLEGYTAFDLYNSTVNDTSPSEGDTEAELYTWGANRYAPGYIERRAMLIACASVTRHWEWAMKTTGHSPTTSSFSPKKIPQ